MAPKNAMVLGRGQLIAGDFKRGLARMSITLTIGPELALGTTGRWRF